MKTKSFRDLKERFWREKENEEDESIQVNEKIGASVAFILWDVEEWTNENESRGSIVIAVDCVWYGRMRLVCAVCTGY